MSYKGEHGRTPTIKTYKDWTYGAYLCWKAGCNCSQCSEKKICDSVKPIGKIPYGMKPMKFAVMKLVEKFGTEGLDEIYGNYVFENDIGLGK